MYMYSCYCYYLQCYGKIYTYLVSLGTAIVDVSFTFPIYVPVVVVDFWHVTQVHSRGFRIQQRPLV